jgi:receptor expression-enhancing protein 5/6
MAGDSKVFYIGCAVFLVLFLALDHPTSQVVSLVGFLYPAYASVKAIESTDKDDDTTWLMYWVVYSSFSIAEFYLDIVASWLPMYFLFKCAFLVWCMYPCGSGYNGSLLIYNKIIAPFVKQHDAAITEAVDLAKEKAEELKEKYESGELMKEAEKIKGMVGDAISSATDKKEE